MYVLFYTFICCFALHFIVFISSVFYQTLYSLLLVSRPTASCLFGGICAHFTVYFYSNKRILKGWWQCFSLLVYSFITLCHSQPFSFIFTMFAILRLCISCVKCFVVDAVACVFACALTSAVRGLLPVVV